MPRPTHSQARLRIAIGGLAGELDRNRSLCFGDCKVRGSCGGVWRRRGGDLGRPGPWPSGADWRGQPRGWERQPSHTERAQQQTWSGRPTKLPSLPSYVRNHLLVAQSLHHNCRSLCFSPRLHSPRLIQQLQRMLRLQARNSCLRGFRHPSPGTSLLRCRRETSLRVDPDRQLPSHTSWRPSRQGQPLAARTRPASSRT